MYAADIDFSGLNVPSGRAAAAEAKRSAAGFADPPRALPGLQFGRFMTASQLTGKPLVLRGVEWSITAMCAATACYLYFGA